MTALARNTDPISSHIAASHVNTEKQRNLVLSALKAVGHSVTAKELSKIMTRGHTEQDEERIYYMIQRRVSDLVKKGLVKRGEVVKDIFTGRSATLLELIK